MNNTEKIIVDAETGEIVNETYEGDLIKVTRKGTVDFLLSRKVWNTESFFKGYTDELRKLLPILNHSEKALLLSVAPYVGYYSCNLRFTNGKDITAKHIAEITGYSEKTTGKILQSLIDKDILYKGKNSATQQWFVNPWLFSRGSVINPVLQEMFKNYYIQTKGCRWKNLRGNDG